MEIKLDTKELERIAGKLDRTVEAVCRRMAFEIEAEAKPIAPYDTGALQNSIYVVTQNEDNYSNASGKAASHNPKAQTTPHPVPTGKVIARVGPCVNYAGYVEFGTSRQAAQPYLTPAFEAVTGRYNSGKEWEEIVR